MGPTFISNIFLSFWTKLVEMLDENVNPLKKAIQHLYPTFFSISSIHSSIFKMAAYKGAVVMVLTKLVDSDDEKPCWAKAKEWIKKRRESGYFQNTVQELRVEDRTGFKDMLPMSVTDYELLLSQISDFISPNGRRQNSGTDFKISCYWWIFSAP